MKIESTGFADDLGSNSKDGIKGEPGFWPKRLEVWGVACGKSQFEGKTVETVFFFFDFSGDMEPARGYSGL